MNIGPLIQREIVEAPRRWRTYYGRMFPVLLGICITLWCYYFMIFVGGGMPGFLRPLNCFAAAFFCYAFFLGLGRICDSLSEEKREGTLGLLFLTHLKPSDIVLGKLSCYLLRQIYLFLAI